MAINPELITTIRVDQLPDGTLNLTNKIPHTSGTVLEKASVQELVDLVATSIGVSGGVGYLALSVTDGQQLPDVPELPSFFLCGAGTFLNINGYPNIICTENLNAIMSLTDHWELAVEIPINPLSGSVQSVTGSAVDNTDPLNPVINEIIYGVQNIVAGTNITVDNTDPSNPIINATGGGATPTLQEVLTEGGRPLKDITGLSPYDLIEEDKTFTLAYADVGTINLNEGVFVDGDEIEIINIRGVNTELFNNNNVNEFYYNGSLVPFGSSVTIPVGSKAILKQLGGITGPFSLNIITENITAPSLNDVTAVGNTSNQSIIIQETGVSNIEINTNSITRNAFEHGGALALNFPSSTSANSQQFQDASGTIALLSDIAQVNSDWNATSGVEEILNKPTIPDTSTFVPYTGANANVDLGEYELKAGQIELDTTPTGTAGVAVTRWNDTIGSSETTLKGGNVILKNGVDLVARIVNKVTPNTTLTKAAYQVVRISGAQGQRLAVNLAQGNTDLNSADTLGIVTETIPTNQEGFIITVGQLENINTTGSLQGETWTDGDVLYLSPTTAGRITNIKPNGSTGHIVVLGYVEYAHANNGKIYVKIMNGWELDELHNVFIDTPLNNQALTYETSTDLWKNKTIIEDSITNGVTAIAPSQNAVFDALALKQNVVSGVSDTEIGYLDGVTSAIQTQLNARCQSLYNLTSQITHTGTTAKTLLLTYFIPANTFTDGDFLIFSAIVTKVANIANTTHTIEINTTNTLTGATIISTAALNTVNNSMKFKREIALTGGNGYVVNVGNNATNDQSQNSSAGNLTFTYNLAADLYLFVTCQLPNATDSITYRGLSITKN